MLKIIAEKNLLTPEAVKEKIMQKLNALEKLVLSAGQPNEMRVQLEKMNYFEPKGSVFRCEINVRVPGKILRAESEKTDILAAATETKNTMERLLKDYKEKHFQKTKENMRAAKKKIKSEPPE